MSDNHFAGTTLSAVFSKGAGPHWAHPFIGEQKLLVRHGDVLMVYNISEK